MGNKKNAEEKTKKNKRRNTITIDNQKSRNTSKKVKKKSRRVLKTVVTILILLIIFGFSYLGYKIYKNGPISNWYLSRYHDWYWGFNWGTENNQSIPSRLLWYKSRLHGLRISYSYYISIVKWYIIANGKHKTDLL